MISVPEQGKLELLSEDQCVQRLSEVVSMGHLDCLHDKCTESHAMHIKTVPLLPQNVTLVVVHDCTYPVQGGE